MRMSGGLTLLLLSAVALPPTRAVLPLDYSSFVRPAVFDRSGLLHLRAAASLGSEPPPAFPTPESTPAEVVSAQLRALSDSDLMRVYQLFSRARRAIIVESGRAQGGGDALTPPTHQLRERVRAAVDASCPGLIGHASAEILSGLTVCGRTDGRMPQWRCRVRVETFYADMYDTCDGGFLAAAAAAAPPSYFVFTLTHQHDEPPTERELSIADPRDAARFDGFDGCWLVWSIERERRGGGGDDDTPGGDDDPLPARERALPLQLAGRST